MLPRSRFRLPIFSTTLAAGFLLSASGHALQQPDGTTIPQTSALQDLFDARGESIDALADAVTIPETFTPSCNLTFEVIARGAGYLNTFGWYNADGNAPNDSQLFEFLACDDAVGTTKQFNIAGDVNYLGGEVGFYQGAGPQACPPGPQPGAAENIFFSEIAYNPDSSQQNPTIHLLIYNSTVTPNAFYFAWEDLIAGGDNDFDDLVTFVSGITCTGGGGSCQTGQLGICAEGTEQCQNGALTCVGLNDSTTETCDGLDNNCDGETDEGDLCPSNEVCDKGSCVPTCTGGEYPCPPGKVCDITGLCIDADCVDVDCPANTKCVDGTCVGPCDGVTCPYGQVCLVGACVDPCDKITCDSNQVCDLGVCTDPCSCAGCAAGTACQTDGICVPDACDGMTCPDGTHCDSTGTCVDDCMGAVCPAGEVCAAGECQPDMGTGGGGGAESSSSSGIVLVGGGSSTGGSSAANGSGGADAGGASAGSGGFATVEESGCGCRVPGGRAAGTGITLWLLALGMWLRRRLRD